LWNVWKQYRRYENSRGDKSAKEGNVEGYVKSPQGRNKRTSVEGSRSRSGKSEVPEGGTRDEIADVRSLGANSAAVTIQSSPSMPARWAGGWDGALKEAETQVWEGKVDAACGTYPHLIREKIELVTEVAYGLR